MPVARKVPPDLMPLTRKREPIRPAGAPRLDEKFIDWRDFTNRVCRPWLDNDGENARSDAWYSVLVTNAGPWYLASALVIADNRIRELEALLNGGARDD
jgi:hypothetical protein